jgi:SpoIID/LytB domain protein
MFVVKLEGGSATFRGGGFGHGVGLCQTGSIGMAEAGKSYKDILRHYYQGSVLRKLW